MDYAYLALSGVLVLVGIVGCFVPVIPGPFVAYCGLLTLLPTKGAPSMSTLVCFGVAVVGVTVLDFVVPAIGARWFKCTKLGMWGCFIGTLCGLFFFPVGLLLGPFLGAFLGELIARKPIGAAVLGGLGALLGFLSGLFVKTVACVAILVYLIMNIMENI